MDSRLERKLQYAAAWCGPVFLVGYLISFGLLGHNHPDLPHFSVELSPGLAGGGPGFRGSAIDGGGDAGEVQDLQLQLGELGFEDLDEVPGGVAELVPGDVGGELEDPGAGGGGAPGNGRG